MQITLDTARDTPADFLVAATWLRALAGQPIPTDSVPPALAAATNHVRATSVIAPEDQPDAGALFVGNGAPSTAAAEVFPTAPVVPLAGVPNPPPVVLPPVVAAPTSSAPLAPVPPAPLANGVEVDSSGLPWDARIHSLGANNTHPKAADGKWKRKRGINGGTLVADVEKELRALMAIPGGAAIITPLPVPPAPLPAVPVAPPAVPPAPPVVPVVPPAPIAPPAPPAPGAPVADMPGLMRKITDAMGTGKLTQAQVLDAVRSVGLTELPQLMQRPDFIPAVSQHIDAVLLMAP